MKRILLLSIAGLIITSVSAQNLVVNGNLEGSKLNSFRVNDFPGGIRSELQEPRIVTDDSLNHFIVVTTNNKYPTTLNSYSNLFLTLNRALNKYSRVILSMKIKADQDLSIGIEMQSTPGNSISYVHSFSATTEWKTYTDTLYVYHDNVQTIAFDFSLGDGKKIDLYFDDFFIEDVISFTDSWRTAKVFLEQKGVQSLNLSCRFSTDTFHAFTDYKNKSFVIVASKKYVQCLDNPILAYGIDESSIWDAESGFINKDDNVMKVILSQYERQLEHLYNNNIEYSYRFDSIYEPKPEGVSPLLGTIAYNQRAPYNKLFPYDSIYGKVEKCLAGCGPIAVAQVLSYYKYPVTPAGTVTFSTKSGKEYTVNLEQYPVKWDGTEDDVANLVFDCAASMSLKMGPEGTRSSIRNIKSALNMYWAFNSREINTGYKERLQSIYNELDNKRPVILSGGNHLYVCDGYDNDYLHYNFGWSGLNNGYYRIIIITPDVFNNGLIHMVGGTLVGIEPQKQ